MPCILWSKAGSSTPSEGGYGCESIEHAKEAVQTAVSQQKKSVEPSCGAQAAAFAALHVDPTQPVDDLWENPTGRAKIEVKKVKSWRMVLPEPEPDPESGSQLPFAILARGDAS